MSFRSMVWALDQNICPSGRKFVLVALASFAADDGRSFPHVETLASMTNQDIKTVRRALHTLVSDGFIEDSGNRVGATGQIRVYQFPEIKIQRLPKTDTFESESLIERLPQGGHKVDTRLPKTDILHIVGTGTGTGTKANVAELPPIPEHLSTPEVENAWKEWIQHRKEKKIPMTPLAASKNFMKLRDWGRARWIAAIDASIANGYQGLFEVKESVNKISQPLMHFPEIKRPENSMFSKLMETI